MATDAYRATVPVFTRFFANLEVCCDKAANFAVARGMSDEQLMAARIYPDMLPFATQIRIASDTAKGAGARLTGAAPPSYPDDEKTLAELKARIAKTVAYVESLPPEAFAGADERPITLKLGPNTVEFTGEDYLHNFVLPNFYFHVTTAYAILRSMGVEIGKRDFLGG